MEYYKTAIMLASFSYSSLSTEVVYVQSWVFNPAGSRVRVELCCFKLSLSPLQGSLHHDIVARGC